MNGHSATIVNRIPGITMPGMNGEGIVIPRIVGSKDGKIRSAPSSQPTYQSGWAGELTTAASNGPYSQTGLIWNEAAEQRHDRGRQEEQAAERKAWPGQNAGRRRCPHGPGRRGTGCASGRTSKATCAAIRPITAPGSSRMWSTKNRLMKVGRRELAAERAATPPTDR